jgi:hypothetical protein
MGRPTAPATAMAGTDDASWTPWIAGAAHHELPFHAAPVTSLIQNEVPGPKDIVLHQLVARRRQHPTMAANSQPVIRWTNRWLYWDLPHRAPSSGTC